MKNYVKECKLFVCSVFCQRVAAKCFALFVLIYCMTWQHSFTLNCEGKIRSRSFIWKYSYHWLNTDVAALEFKKIWLLEVHLLRRVSVFQVSVVRILLLVLVSPHNVILNGWLVLAVAQDALSLSCQASERRSLAKCPSAVWVLLRDIYWVRPSY